MILAQNKAETQKYIKIRNQIHLKGNVTAPKCLIAHRPRIDLNKRFLPRSNTGKKLVQFEWNEDFPETID